MNSTLSPPPPPPGAASTMNNNSEWTLAEKIRLLELYMDKDLLWDQRAEMIQKEFAKRRPLDFFCVQNVRHELHKIFNKPNPEHHVYGMPVHPRGREAAELWLKCFRKEYTEQCERKKQMFAVTLRHQMDLIRRYQQGKLTAEEIDAIVTEAREKDAKRPNREIYEAKLKEMMDKHHKDDLKNIRSNADYCNYMRGERVPTPPPEPPKIEQLQLKTEQPQVVSTVLGASPARSFGSPEPVLKDIQNNAKAASTTTVINATSVITNDVELPSDLLEESHQMQVEETPKTENEKDIEDKSEEEVPQKKEEQNKFEEISLDEQFNMDKESEASAEVVLPLHNRITCELTTRESILTKTSQTFALAKKGGKEGDEHAQTVRDAPNTISMEIKVLPALSMPMPQLPMENGELSQGPKSPSTTSPIISPSSPVLTLKPTRKSVTPVSSSPVVAKKKSVKTQAATDARKKKAEEKRLQEQREKSEEKKGTNKEKQQLRQTYSVVEPKTAWATTTETPARPRKRKRGELDFLSPELISSEEIGGPPARNLRRSSQQLSPAPASTLSATSSEKEKETVIITTPSAKESPKEQPPQTPPAPADVLESKPQPPIFSHIAVTTKVRSSLRRAALATATPSPAVDSIGENGLFLRPGNHTSNEVIPKQVLLTLCKDIRTHRFSYVFESPVSEVAVPGYHSAIKKPMDLKTLRACIESGTVQTFGQFTHNILLMFANAVMYNSTGHHVNTYAKEMLSYALKNIEVVQYPDGIWSSNITTTESTGSRQSNASESDAGDGRVSRSSSGISSSAGTTGLTRSIQRSRSGIGGGGKKASSSASTPTTTMGIRQDFYDESQPSTSAICVTPHQQSPALVPKNVDGETGSANTKRRTSQRGSGNRQQ